MSLEQPCRKCDGIHRPSDCPMECQQLDIKIKKYLETVHGKNADINEVATQISTISMLHNMEHPERISILTGIWLKARRWIVVNDHVTLTIIITGFFLIITQLMWLLFHIV